MDLVLLDASNAYLLGSYQTALKLLQKIKTTNDSIQLKVNTLTYRIYIAQKKYGIVLDEVSFDTEHVELQLVRLLALFLSTPSQRSHVLSELEKFLSNSLNPDDESALILLSTIYLNAELPDHALRFLHAGNEMNTNAMRVQCYMAMHRYDLAEKTVRRMQVADEDALSCQLATALYNISKGGEKLQEALSIYEELKDKHGATPVLLNGLASAYIGTNRWDEAETVLQEALDMDNCNADALVNLLMVYHHLAKPVEIINRVNSQIRDADKEHRFLSDYAVKEEEFTRCVENYAPSVLG